jgi:putative thioredoxin
MIDATPGNEIPKLINEAEELLKEKKYEEAQSAFENLIGMDPGNPKVMIGLLRCLMQLHKYDDAKEMFESLDDEILKNEEILKIKKLLDNLNATDSVSTEDLKLKLSSDSNNLELRFELAKAYLSNNDAENGFNELLEIFKANSKWNDEAAKKKLLEFFDLLGPADPNVLNARRKLSSLMFK